MVFSNVTDIKKGFFLINFNFLFYSYIRTSCKKFNLKSLDKMVHLTNDAI